MTTKKKLLIGLGIVLLFLIVTNPTNKQFEEFTDSNGTRYWNFFVFSLYHDNVWNRDYVGIAGNFFYLPKK